MVCLIFFFTRYCSDACTLTNSEVTRYRDTVTDTSSDSPRAWRELQHTILGGWVGRLYSTYHIKLQPFDSPHILITH